jgi:hypothetical protein
MAIKTLWIVSLLATTACEGAVESGARDRGRGATSTRTDFTFAPLISSDCRALAAPAAAGWRETPVGSCQGSNGYWLLSGTNEDIDFNNYRLNQGELHMSDLRPQGAGEHDSPWNYAFHRLGDRYRLGWVLDKVNYPKYLDRHTGVFLNDSFDHNRHVRRPTVADNLIVELDARLRANDQTTDHQTVVSIYTGPQLDTLVQDPAGRRIGAAKNRVTVGITATHSDGTTYFLEVNLFRSANWDQVPDSADLMDRQAHWDVTSTSGKRLKGQVAYFNGPRLSRLPGISADLPRLGASWSHFRIPVSDLFRRYSWPYATGDWGQVSINGVYIGTEIWGRGRIWFEMENYRLYGTQAGSSKSSGSTGSGSTGSGSTGSGSTGSGSTGSGSTGSGSTGTATPLELRWSSAGPIPQMICTQWIEPSDPHTWHDNYLCASRDLGMRWSHRGPIAGMRCTRIHEGAEPQQHGWQDNYLCLPPSSEVKLSWNSARPLPGMQCVRITEGADPHTWHDNYLCYQVAASSAAAGARCNPVTQPAPHWGMKAGRCLGSCGRIGGRAAFHEPCWQHGMAAAGEAYDVPYCCK